MALEEELSEEKKRREESSSFSLCSLLEERGLRPLSSSPSGTTNQELDELASQLQILNYVPCKMKNELRLRTVGKRECGIINLQNSGQAGSHWVLFLKDDLQTIAYSNFGDPAPQELIDYLGDKVENGTQIYTSDIKIQNFFDKSCGDYCIAILYLLSQKIFFEDIIQGFKGGERS